MVEINEYEKQAEDFLKETGTTELFHMHSQDTAEQVSILSTWCPTPIHPRWSGTQVRQAGLTLPGLAACVICGMQTPATIPASPPDQPAISLSDRR